MKNKLLKNLLFLSLLLFTFSTCSKDEVKEPDISFLNDIRPTYFENLNFESQTIIKKTPLFLSIFSETFDKLELEYNTGMLTSQDDLENFRLVSMYYSFYLLAITGTYLDGNIAFNDINNYNETGFFSGLNSNNPDFEQLEMEAMMQRAEEVIAPAVTINGYNDKTNGFYIAIKQVHERVKNNNLSNPKVHGDAIDYVAVRLVRYDVIANWNVLMSMVTMTNYEDSLNTFSNPRMDELLFNVNARLIPGALPDLGGRYPEILGPLYRFDLNLKKVDWLLTKHEALSEEQVNKIDNYIKTLETASNYIKEEKADLLNSWPHKYTFGQRIEWLNKIKKYRENLSGKKPFLGELINSKDFKKAYQCYSCHKSSGL